MVLAGIPVPEEQPGRGDEDESDFEEGEEEECREDDPEEEPGVLLDLGPTPAPTPAPEAPEAPSSSHETARALVHLPDLISLGPRQKIRRTATAGTLKDEPEPILAILDVNQVFQGPCPAPAKTKDMAPKTTKGMAPKTTEDMAPKTAEDMAPKTTKDMAPKTADMDTAPETTQTLKSVVDDLVSNSEPGPLVSTIPPLWSLKL